MNIHPLIKAQADGPENNRRRLSESFDRDLKIVVVYGKRLTSDTLFAIKANSLTVKCFTYRIYLNYRQRHIDTLFNYRNLAVDHYMIFC